MKTELANYLNAETEKERANRTPNKAQPDTARHSPLPWKIQQTSDGTLDIAYCDNELRSVIARLHVEHLCDEHGGSIAGNAKLIVRAVNNAGKLAEALREIAVRLDGQVRRASNDRTVTESEKIAREVLEDYDRNAQ